MRRIPDVKNCSFEKIPREIRSALERNGFTFTRYSSHAVFTHSASKKVFTVPVSKGGGRGRFSGQQFVISQLKTFLKNEGLPFLEEK